LPWIDWP